MLHQYPDPGIDSHTADSRLWWRARCLPELRVVLCADSIELFLLRRHWRLARQIELLDHQVYQVHATQSGSVLQPANAEAVLATLGQALADMRARHAGKGVHAVVILSNVWVRWLVVPWQADISGKAERVAYAMHWMQQHFGEGMQDWPMTSLPSAYGEPSLHNAVPPGLVSRLQALFAQQQWPLGAVYPAWMLSANRALHAIRQHRLSAEGWVVCRESHALTVAYLQRGQWQSIHTYTLDPAGPAWSVLLQQGLLRAQVLNPAFQGVQVFVDDADVACLHEVLGEAFQVRGMQAPLSLVTALNMPLHRKAA